MTSRRWSAVVVLAAIVAGLLALSAERSPRRAASFGSAAVRPVPVAAPANANVSTWYCAAGQARPGALNLSLVLANGTGRDRTATITWFPGAVRRTVTVPANDSVSLLATDALPPSDTASAIVELDGGGVAVEHTVADASGTGVAPCATQASDRWYFADGVTEVDAREALALFNPFPDDAVVDISFSTEQGRAEPRELQGFPVPAGSMVFVPVQDHVRRRAVAAAEITARTGRLVVDRLVKFDGSAGRSGVSLALGAPAGAERWSFPDGLFQQGSLTEAWHLYNPNDEEAGVTISIAPASGSAPDPIDLTLPPHTQQTLDAAAAKVLPDVPHSVTIASRNGVPIVAERRVDSRRPSARVGWSSSSGAAVTSRTWLFAVGEAGPRTDEWLVVQNPSAKDVTVSVHALAGGARLPIEGLQELSVPAGGRLAVRLGDHIQRSPLPLLVEASGPVAVERDAYGVSRVGVSITLGIPFS